MFRTVAFRAQVKPVSSATRRRTFVSTVLLTRAWENDTVATLRQEARNRGLSYRGNKATLITRLQEYDQQNPMQHATSPVTPPTPPIQHVRLASTVEVPATEVPGVPSSAEPPSPPAHFPKITLPLIPDASEPIPEPSVQIPFTPDYWESSRVKAQENSEDLLDVTTPNLIAVAGDASHISASPSHNLYTGIEGEEQASAQSTDKSFIQEIADVLFIPTSWPKSDNASHEEVRSRSLDKDEKTGLWVLLGVFVGSWVAAGVFQAPSKFATKAEEALEEAASATAPTPAH